MIKINPYRYNFNLNGDNIILRVESDFSWSTTNEDDSRNWNLPSWMKINNESPDKLSGSSGISTFNISVDPNLQNENRKFCFSIKTSNNSYSFPIYSQLKPYISVIGDGISYYGDGNTWIGSGPFSTNGSASNGSFSVHTNNSSWSVVSDSDWLYVSANDYVYELGGSIIITCLENINSLRTGKLTFTSSDGAVQEIIFNQSKKVSLEINYNDIAQMYIGNDTIELPYQAIGSSAIKIVSMPSPFTVNITKGGDWLRLYNNTYGVYLIDDILMKYNGGFNLDYDENIIPFDRYGEISVTCKNVTKKITVKQKATEKIFHYVTSIKDGVKGDLILMYQPVIGEFYNNETIKITTGPYAGISGTIWNIYYADSGGLLLGSVRNLYLDVPISSIIYGSGSFIREKQFNYVKSIKDGIEGKLILMYQPVHDEFYRGNKIKIITGPYAGKICTITYVYVANEGGILPGEVRNLYLDIPFISDGSGVFIKV